MTCTTNGGDTAERRTSMEPLTATAPEVGIASPTSRSRRTRYRPARGRAAFRPVRQPIAAPQDAAGAIVDRHGPPAPVQLDDAYPWVVEQGGNRRVPCLGADQRLPDADEEPDMRQQRRDHRDPRRPPAIRVDRIAEIPGDVGAVQPFEPHVQAVLATAPRQRLVLGERGLQLLGCEQVLVGHQETVGLLPKARHAFVDGVVVLKVVAVRVFAALAPAVQSTTRTRTSSFGPSPTRRSLPSMPQASSMRAETAGQQASSSIASCNDDRMCSNAS